MTWIAALVFVAAPAMSQTLERALGPLGENLELEREGDWKYRFEGGWFVMENFGNADRSHIRYHMPDAAPGLRRYETRIAAQRTFGSELVALGLVYDIDEQGRNWSALAIGLDGRVHALRARDGIFEPFADPEWGRFANDGTDILVVEDRGGGQVVALLNGEEVFRTVHEQRPNGRFGIISVGPGRFAFSDVKATYDAGIQSEAQVPEAVVDAAPEELAGLSAYQRRRSAMIAGATMGILFHEMGHAILGELDLPATGPEEDVADEFSALAMSSITQDEVLASVSAEVRAFLVDMVQYATLMWHFDSTRAQREGLRVPWYGEHAPSEIRFRNTLCMIYGSNPEIHVNLVEAVDFPERSRERCVSDYQRRYDAWERLMDQYQGLGEDAGSDGNVRVVFHPSQHELGQSLMPTLRDGELIEGLAALFDDYFAWPRDLTILFMDCGVTNAFYDPQYGRVIMCWEGIEHFARIVLEHEGATDPGGPSDPTQGPSS